MTRKLDRFKEVNNYLDKLKSIRYLCKMIYRYFKKKYYLNILKKPRRCTTCNPKYDTNVYGNVFPCDDCIMKIDNKYKHF